MGSEQESVRHPVFIGFLGLRPWGLTRFDGIGSELSPMFIGLSAHYCIPRRRMLKSPGFRFLPTSAVVRHTGCLKHRASSTRQPNRTVRLLDPSGLGEPNRPEDTVK